MNIATFTSDLVQGLIFLLGLCKITVDQQIQQQISTFVIAGIGLAVSLWSIYKHLNPSGNSTGSSSSSISAPLRWLAIGLLALAASRSLIACTSAPPPSYISADQTTFNAIAPEYQAYVNADETLTPAEKQQRSDTISTWQLRIEHGLNASTASTQP